MDFARKTRIPVVLCLVLLLSTTLAWAEAPRIGLIYATAKVERLEKESKDPQQQYRAAIEDNGGVVVVLGQSHDARAITEKLKSLDAVLLPGGIDVDPQFYGESRHERLEKTDAELDRLEFRALDHAKANHLPVLGICRGHQVLNVYYGGSLIQDIPTEYETEVKVKHRYPPGSKAPREHPITITPDSLLHRLLGTERIVVNTYHHQAVKRVAEGFAVVARSEDGIVEAIERGGEAPILGVQFHPEKIRGKRPEFDALFAWLVEESRKAQARHCAPVLPTTASTTGARQALPAGPSSRGHTPP